MATTDQAVKPPSTDAAPTLGVDEFNLAEFPISVLGRYQPLDGDGTKQDSIVYEATTYDSKAKRRVKQKVTLATSKKIGLPVAEAEEVVLALAYLAKLNDSRFKERRVPFAAKSIYRLLGWSSNADSYTRLGEYLKQLQALSIFYENAWWQNGKRRRQYGTGIISDHLLVEEAPGPKPADYVPQSWVVWTEGFHTSLKRGNIKQLDLTRLRTLRAQVTKMAYRFLEKRFYTQRDGFTMPVVELGRGHLGIRHEAIPDIKREINRACRELETISDKRFPDSAGFIEPVSRPKQRYSRDEKGVWRITVRPGPLWHAEQQKKRRNERKCPTSGAEPDDSAHQLVGHFYEKWTDSTDIKPSPKELELASSYIDKYGDNATRLLDHAIRQMKDRFPSAESFGATRNYVARAAANVVAAAKRKRSSNQASKLDAVDRQRTDASKKERRRLERQYGSVWKNNLSAHEREEITQVVFARRYPNVTHPRTKKQLLASHHFYISCLHEMEARFESRRTGESH